jgi:uncharacterized protein YecE (DUF72 family)
MAGLQDLQNFHGGLSGLELPIPKYEYPPEFQKGSRLAYYASIFNTIEINSSFYKIPMQRTIEKWAACVGENFRFTFKLFKDITHCRGLRFQPADVDRFIRTITHVGSRCGCLLIQFPPSLKKEHLLELETLLGTVRDSDKDGHWQIAVEFRDASWYTEELYDLLHEYGATLVLQDIPKSATPFSAVRSNVVYARFHGPTGNYRGSYTTAFLGEFAEYIREWLQDGKTVYLYFNNTAGDAFNNLTTLNKLVRSAEII